MINVAVVGLGYWGPNLARNVYMSGDMELAGLADSDSLCLARMCHAYPLAASTKDYRDLLRADVELVMIATPPETHFKIAGDFLRSGRHVLIAKPMASTRREAEGLAALAASKGLHIFVDHTFAFHPVVDRMRREMASKAFGRPLYYESERVNLGRLQQGADVIGDLLPHDVSILHCLQPGLEIERVRALASRHLHPTRSDRAHVMIETSSGLEAHVHVGWLSPVKIRKAVVGGERRMLLWDDVHPFEKLRLYTNRVDVDISLDSPFEPTYVTGDTTILSIPRDEPLALELRGVADTLLRGRPVACGPEQGLGVMRVLEACHKSARAGGRPVRVR